MPAIQYPFIDIAVHARVRERFARGEAMVLFSDDLSGLLWANGAGAELFGHAAVYDLLDQGVNHADITFRQLEAAARQLGNVGDSRNFLIRIAKGFQRAQAQAACELIRLSSGEKAILFSVPVSAGPLAAEASAARMLQGLDDPDTHMAVIGSDGEIIAASPGFASLGITGQTAKALIGQASTHPDRLVKRPLATGKGYLPAAVGRLSDEPALNLLFAVETATGNPDATGQPADAEDAATAGPDQETQPAADFTDVIDAVSDIEEVEEALEDIDGEPDQQATETPVAPAEETRPEVDHISPAETANAEATPVPEADGDAPAPSAEEAAASVVAPAAEVTTARPDPKPAKTPSSEVVADPPNGFVFKPNSRATRFVWKIDAGGRFSEVSHEFAEAVGPHAANIIGTTFSDIAALFNLDPENRLSEALARRDTWSGKTIHWPVEGTSLVVPVDLAALPTYTRNRDFDGFRGFGVVRLSDAQEDPLALGLTLGPEGIGRDVASLDQPVEEDRSEAASGEEAHASEDPRDEATAAEEPASPSQEETPAASAEPARTDTETPPVLRIVETPNRRLTDKIVQLHGVGSELTAAEQANFREIAKRLEAFGARLDESVIPLPAEPAPVAAETADRSKEETAAPPAEEVSAQEEAAPQDALFEKADEELTAQDAAAESPQEAAAEEAISEDAAGAQPEEQSTERQDEPVEGLEETVSQIEVLTTFIPPRVKMTDGLSAGTVDQLPIALLIHAGDALIHANPEFMRLTGYASLDSLREVGGIDALLQRQELEEKAGGSGTMMLVKADDALVPVTARLQSVRWEGANALLLALMPVDGNGGSKGDTARPDTRPDRLVEKVAKLQVEVEELHSILETATDGVVVIGAEGDIRSMNRSASALFNYDEQETRGKPFVMLFAHESQKAVLDYLNGLSGHGVASVLNDGREVIGREASGGFVPLFMTMGRLTSSSGYCAVIRDITQWKRTEDELRNAKGAAETANAHKTDFLARVSHEIRTPLNAIIGFSDMMASERFGPIGHPRYIEYANDIGRSGRHVLDIVNDLLDISKIEAGEMDLDFASVGLNEAISEAVALVQPQANSQRVIIRTALSQSVPDVVADLRSIKQIALNILSNAIRFTPSGGQIVVSTSYEANGSVVLRVRDTGIGMTRSELDQAMKPFRQVSSTQSRHRGDGTGLGLPLTKAMVDANRATFSINSAPNEGTLVEITFPSPRVLAG
ncbi:ATP-binding protein [Rhizobium binxianense]